MCRVIAVANQKGGCGYEKLHIMWERQQPASILVQH